MKSEIDNSKECFLKTWPGGYGENWEVYGAASGKTEKEVVDKCLTPFLNQFGVCLEIGCGIGFWTRKYLAPNFSTVVALDLLPDMKDKPGNVHYIEVPDRDFSCYGVPDNTVDFAWSFGVFCHLSLDACAEYVRSIFRVLKPGAKCALYFSNADRRPSQPMGAFDPSTPQWVHNTYEKSYGMLRDAGFIGIRDLMPELFDTMISGTKPL